MEPKSPTKQPPGTERFRDEQRDDRGPTYGGEDWDVADERGEARFGKARNDDADPRELLKAGESDATAEGAEAVEQPDEDDSGDADGASETESSGQRAGMGRGEAPRKLKSRSK